MSLLHDQFAGPVLSLLSVQNIESELSYAYLHAVAAQAGVSCTQGSRHEYNHGIDARLLGLASNRQFGLTVPKRKDGR